MDFNEIQGNDKISYVRESAMKDSSIYIIWKNMQVWTRKYASEE
jgi:hypothetical protein